jgi:hypothetical protein
MKIRGLDQQELGVRPITCPFFSVTIRAMFFKQDFPILRVAWNFLTERQNGPGHYEDETEKTKAFVLLPHHVLLLAYL